MNWAAIYNGVWWPTNNSSGGIPCNTTAQPGGDGVTDNTIALDPGGGVITLQFTAYGISDKLEISHGVFSNKVATTGMTANSNFGPFDNVYGTEPSNVVPTEAQTLNLPQFIGTSKGAIPDRGVEYTQDTGIANPLSSPYQQLVWWSYDSVDYQTAPFVTVRVTGPTNTQWQFQRIC
tara:strand:- start:198 stop:728 length:531 start_codon:yes stop_codon:yes gene_type:complete